MKSSRRSFLSASLGVSLTSAAIAADERSRRSRMEMILNSDPMVPSAHKPKPDAWDHQTVSAAWLGHATVLLNFYGIRIITDPVLSDRVGIAVGNLFTIGPRRLVEPALRYHDLPPIDIILLSHAHMDHLDIPTLDRFDRSIPVIVAQNTADVIEDLGFSTVYELDWGEWANLRNLDLRVEALEVKHFGWRFPWEKDRSRGFAEGRSYNAYLLSHGGHHVVFGGDTAYHNGFRALAERGLDIELAMMPIGAYDPWISNHCTPEQAVEMADHMRARAILPMHWRTFVQSNEPTMEPIARFRSALAGAPHRIALDTIGQEWCLSGSPASGVAADG